MNARKEFNRAAAQAAREAGVYSIVMGEWDRLDRTLTPEAAVMALAILLDPEEPAKAPKKARKGKKAPKAVEPVVEVVEPAYALKLTPVKVRAAIEAGMEAPSESEDRYTIRVKVDGRFKAAKVLRECGFEVKGGFAVIHVHAGKAGAKAVTSHLADLFRACDLWGASDGQVSEVVFNA